MSTKELSFSAKTYWYRTATLFVCAIFIFCYTGFYIALKPSQALWAALWCATTYAIAQLLIMPVLHKFFVRGMEKDIVLFESNSLTDVQDRTRLFLSMVHYPFESAIKTFIYAAMATGFLSIVYHKFPGIAIDTRTARISYIACLFGSYTTAIIIYHFSEKITKPYIERILKSGIDPSILERKNFFGAQKPYFGLSILARCIIFLFIPFVFSNILSYFMLRQGYMILNGMVLGPKDQIVRIIFANVIQIILSGALILLFCRYMNQNNQQLCDVSMGLLENGNPNIEIETTLSDQIQYNVYLLGKVISHYKIIMDQFSDIGKDILHSTEDLSIISGKIANSSTEQSADVKEILTTMEDSNALSKNVATRISEVSDGTDKTKEEVSDAFYLLKESINNLSDISNSNQEVINGIKNLATQIDNIDDIVTIIKDIADRTKIIAFNAELEAVSNGKNGRNFHIVATEIRRLANNTMDSIQTIQNYTESIQNASRDLITSSEQSTETIHEEAGISKQLETQFGAIMESSNETNEKATEISGIIEQQTASFNQIVVTLRQISSGIESFAQSTKTITNTVNEMKNIAFKLSNMKDNL